MGIDFKNLVQSYIEESLEMLQVLEDTLIDFEKSEKEADDISLLMRTFHSLKSNSAAFNFDVISQLCHTLETFFEPIRKGEQKITPAAIRELLNVVDCIRETLLKAQNQQSVDESSAKHFIDVFKDLIRKGEASEPFPADQNSSSQKKSPLSQAKGWRILFYPEPDLLMKEEVEPLELFKALEKLGKIEVRGDVGRLPLFPHFTPTECYLGWEIYLQGEINLNDLKNVFFLAETEQNLKIFPLEEEEGFFSPESAALSPQKETIPQGGKDIKREEHSTSIRISTHKVDAILNLVGELVITQSILRQVSKDASDPDVMASHFSEGLLMLENNLRELRESVMQIRMLPLSVILNNANNV